MANGLSFLPKSSRTARRSRTLRRQESRQKNAGISLVKTPTARGGLLWRSLLFMFLTTSIMGVYVHRLVQLQLVHGAENRLLADQNRVRLVPLRSDRGNITDRNGNILAANELSRSIYLWPRQQSQQQWQAVVERLSPIIGVPAEEMIAKLNQAGYNSPVPVRVAQQVNPNAFVVLAENATLFPGVEIIAESSRYYPHGTLAAHILGYIGEATAEDLDANPDYPLGMIVGQMGIERMANATLEGRWGNRLVEVNARGEEIQWLGIEPAISGDPVQLTLDLDVQQTAEQALNGRRGAVVVMDVNTGGVLAMVSGPTFDPNIFTRRVTQTEWDQLQGQADPFLNRALQGYPPGSTFKIVTAAAGMQSGNFSPGSMIGTSAFISVGGTQFWEHSNQGYGVIGFEDALAYSSNTFFYQVGMTAGPEAIAEWSANLGIGTSPIGLDGESLGTVPTPDQKEEMYGEPWYTGDTVSMAIGQGLVQVSPLELAVMVSTIANGGNRVHPHLLSSQTNDPDIVPQPTGIPPEVINIIRQGLIATVQRGTARTLNDGSVPPSGGKTGTSEVVGQESHSLFVGFAPANNPQIAVAAIVENGGYGSVNALPIAHEVYKTYFGRNQ